MFTLFLEYLVMINIEDDAADELRSIDCSSRYELDEWVRKFAWSLIHELSRIRESENDILHTY